VAFCRIDERPIRSRDPIAEPDVVLVQDPTLVHQVDVFGGLRPGGSVLLNTSKDFAALGLDDLEQRLGSDRCVAVPATDIAREHLGRPVPNVPLLGAFAALTGVVSLESVQRAIRDRFGGEIGERNASAAAAAFGLVRKEAVHA
jgi:pyruvate ferredoxin oxidoreductase gamma subunit